MHLTRHDITWNQITYGEPRERNGLEMELTFPEMLFPSGKSVRKSTNVKVSFELKSIEDKERISKLINYNPTPEEIKVNWLRFTFSLLVLVFSIYWYCNYIQQELAKEQENLENVKQTFNGARS